MRESPEPSHSMTRSSLHAHPAVVFFVLTYSISWAGALCFIAPYRLHGEPVPKFTGLMMFPVMLLGPSLTGLFMTGRTQGAAGLRGLFRRMIPPRTGQWYAVLLIPAALILVTLSLFTWFVSPLYKPNFFLIGLSFGVIAGFVEELGWMGFAFPALCRARSAFASAVLLGLLWSAWHIPVVDYLGTGTPHGSWWLAYFLAFAAAMTAIRILLCWVYVNTGSLLLAQLLHAASTGALVVLSPLGVSAAQESLWYGAYACLLWMVAVGLRASFGPGLTRSGSAGPG